MNWEKTTVYVQDNHDRVALASRCAKHMEGAFDGRVLTSQPVRLPAAPNAAQAGHRMQVGDSGTLLSREVEASTGDLSQMVDALKRYLEKRLERVHIHFLNGSTSHCAGVEMMDSRREQPDRL